MHVYYVFWFFISNWSSLKNGDPFWARVEADTPEDACRIVAGWYGPKFAAKATFQVTMFEPVTIKLGP